MRFFAATVLFGAALASVAVQENPDKSVSTTYSCGDNKGVPCPGGGHKVAEPKHEPKKEEPKHEPKKEEPKHEPKKEEPKHEPKKEEPKKEEPKKEEPKHEPKKEEPKHEEPKKEEHPKMTTSTVYATTKVTVTSCAPTITHCPKDSTVVITKTVPISTTICPVTPTHTPTHKVEHPKVEHPTPTPHKPEHPKVEHPKEEHPKYTTSTIYTVSKVTVTSCPPTVTYCPHSSTVVHYSTIPVSTTVCPVTETHPAPQHPSSTPHIQVGTPTAVYPHSSSMSHSSMMSHSSSMVHGPSTSTMTYTNTHGQVTTRLHTVYNDQKTTTSSMVHATPSTPAKPEMPGKVVDGKPTTPVAPHYPGATGGMVHPSYAKGNETSPKGTDSAKGPTPSHFTGAASSVQGSYAMVGLVAVGAILMV